MAAAKKTAANDRYESLGFGFEPEALKDSFDRAQKGFTALSDFQKASLDAVMASAGVFGKRAETVAAEQAAFVRSEYEEAVAAAKAATSSKSVQEAFEVQSEYARSAFERNLGQLNKMTEFWSATAKEASEPLAARYSEFVELVQSYRP